MYKNILLSIGIIILFLGVSIQPAIAVNPISSDNEEDCDICPKVSNLHLERLKSLINKVKTLNNKLSVISKLNPKVAEKYQELSDTITTLSEMYRELKPDTSREHPIICTILFTLFLPSLMKYEIMIIILDRIEDFSLLSFLLIPFAIIGMCSFMLLLMLMADFNCIDFEYTPY